MPYYGATPRDQVDPTDPLPFEIAQDGPWSLPIGAGVCAYDRDECTVTIALDTPEDVRWLVENLPHRNRVKLCDDGPYGMVWLAEGFAPASADTHPKGQDPEEGLGS